MSSVFEVAAAKVNDATIRTFGDDEVVFTNSGGSTAVSADIWTPQDVDEEQAGIYREGFVVIANLPATPVVGDTFTEDGVVYRVETRHFDGVGGLTMGLRKVG